MAATFVLIIAGGLVTSTGSALAVPDWPLSFGMVMPPMVGGILYEHGHRMIAGTVAILMLVLAVWLGWSEPRRWVKVLGFLALGAVIAQAVLGGVTVLLLLPPVVSVAHACLAQTFFCLTIAIAIVTSPRWRLADIPVSGSVTPRISKGPDAPSLPARLAIVVFAVVYIQLIIGAWMRHTDAGLAIPDFPLAFGHWIPPFWSRQIATHFAHRVWALVALCAGTVFIGSVFASGERSPRVRRPAMLLAVLLPTQIALGAFTVLSGKQVAIATAHVATGALILATTLAVSIRLWRPKIEARAAARRGERSPVRPTAASGAGGDCVTA